VTTTTPAATVEPNGTIVQIAIDGFAFKPPKVTVTPGTTVAWTNQDGVSHTATADEGAFRTGTLAPDATFEVVIGGPGTYAYSCSIHPEMRATITAEG
jgi:plastocyanin